MHHRFDMGHIIDSLFYGPFSPITHFPLHNNQPFTEPEPADSISGELTLQATFTHCLQQGNKNTTNSCMTSQPNLFVTSQEANDECPMTIRALLSLNCVIFIYRRHYLSILKHYQTILLTKFIT